MQEKDIIKLIQAKDDSGAEELLLNYGPLMRYIVSPILQSEEDREECISDICMRIWNSIDKFDSSKGSWTGWITVIARNAAISFGKRVGKHSDVDALDTELADNSQDPSYQLVRKEQAELLKYALSQLSSFEYDLFYRKYYYKQAAPQIARELGITVKAAERRLDRIKEKLRKMLSEVL